MDARNGKATTLAEILSERELAEYLGICTRTAARMRETRRGPVHVRIGRKVAYRAADVSAWLEAQRADRRG